MKLTIEFDMDNAAFYDYPLKEAARILEDLAEDIDAQGITEKELRDINGNTVGEYKVEVD